MDAERAEVSGSVSDKQSSSRLKLFLFGTVYFLIIAAYTILRDLKNSVFMGIVGKEYIPWAGVVVMLLFIPAILLYSKLVDKIRRYRLLVWYSLFYAFVTLIMAFFVAHPTIGINNTDQSPYRLFGWLFYFFVEGFTPFVLSVFWAFVSSVTKPDEAKKNYSIMVGGSKVGGILSAGLSWWLLSAATIPLVGVLSGNAKIQVLLVISSLFLFAIPLVISILMRKVAGYHLHGYEAVYKVEKQRSKEDKADTGVFAGLKMFTKHPYVLGIFSMIFFYDMLAKILSYLRLHVAALSGSSVSDVSLFLFQWVFVVQAVGLVISLLVTGPMLRKFGVRTCLLFIPILMAIGSFFFFVSSTINLIMIGYVITKSTHYAFSIPVRELLYIPTLKEIKFKSKSWIDAFGAKMAKSSGATVNIATMWLPSSLAYPALGGLFTVMIGLWCVVAFFLGARFEKAVKNNEVIGMPNNQEE